MLLSPSILKFVPLLFQYTIQGFFPPNPCFIPHEKLQLSESAPSS